MDLQIKDVAELLKVSESTIEKWLSEGKIPGYHLNHQYRFNRHEIESWLLKRAVQPEKVHEESAVKGTGHFILYRGVHQGGVFSQIPGASKEEVIRNTTTLIAPQLNVDAEVLSELLLDREELMPTALGRGIAIPHTRDFLGKDPIDRVFVVFSEQPLSYGALDGVLVHTLFFLFASCDKNHLHLLAKIAHLCSAQANIDFLLTKPTKPKLLEHIRSWEQ